MYCFSHGCHHCHICHPVIAPVRQFWCGVCQRYTYHQHAHWFTAPPVIVRPTIICEAQQRDRDTIRALAD